MINYTNGGTAYKLISSNGPEIILVHGLGMNHKMWSWQVKELSIKYKVIVYDLFGHGDSRDPEDDISLKLFSDQILELISFLKLDKVALIGFSLGGMIVRRFAIDHNDNLWALGILNSAHKRDVKAKKLVQNRVDQVKQFGPSVTVDDAIERWFSKNFQKKNKEIINIVRNWILSNDKQIYPKIYQLLVDGVDELLAPKLAINCPTIIITSDNDFGNSPSMSKAISKQITNSELVILKNLRHMALAEDPKLVNKVLLDFLNTAPKNQYF